MKSLLQKVLIFFSMFFALSIAHAQDYYVSATGSNNNNGLTPETPFLTIQKAGDVVNPGGTVYIMNGTYVRSTFGAVLTMKRSGTAQAYITFKPYPGHNPIITGRAGSWASMVIDGSYIVVEGLEFIGDNANLNYADAYQAYLDQINKVKPPQSKFNTNAISFGSTADVHHLIFRNLKIHDFPGAGLGGGRCDYITIENNNIYNNCWYMVYAGSGISILDPKSIDTDTGYKIFIRNNVVHNNKTLIPWERIKALSDGNGIILDVNIGNGTTTFPYVGRYLVENNVVYNNGGGGVHAYKAAHIDMINNTAYNNGTVVGYPEIDANQCSDVKIYNNIMYARTGGNCNGNDANTIYDYNVYFNGPFFKKGPNDISGVNPQFMTLSTTPATADFRLKNTSPAINNGSNVAGQFSSTDILGVPRPVGFSTDMGAYEYATVIPRTEVVLKQGNTAITDNIGTFDFGDVASTAPKTVTFTIQNIGDQVLNLTGTPKVVTTGTGFSVSVDAPPTVAANGSATFELTLTPTVTGVYSGTVSIANDDADENPYNFTITGYGYDGNKILQTITFNPIPLKIIGSGEFDGAATSSAGLPITYTSSTPGVATIVNGKIRVVGAGTSTITATQAGDAATNPAKNVTQLLTVTPVLPPPGTNMITNPTFDANTTGWSLNFKVGAAATVQSVTQTGYATNVGKVNITSLGTSNTTGSDNIQLGTNIFLVNGRNYLITFTASADAARNLRVELLRNSSPFSTVYGKTQAITTTPTRYGSFAFTSNFTGSVAFRFFVGGNLNPVYLEDVEIIEEPQAITLPEINVKNAGVDVANNGTVSFGNVNVGASKSSTFLVENLGNSILEFSNNPRVSISGAGYSLVRDIQSNLGIAGRDSLIVKFEPGAAGISAGFISIANNDSNESPYRINFTASGVKTNQTITFADSTQATYGDAGHTLAASSSSGLPVSFAVVSGPGSIEGNTLSYNGAGAIVVEATQAGNASINEASPVQQTITVTKKALTVTADNKTVTYGDAIPTLTYSLAGFVFGQTDSVVMGSPELSTPYTPATSASETPSITVATGSLSAANYSFNLVNGQVTINKKDAVVTADNKTVTYGDSAPEYTYTITGQVAGETESGITGSPELSSTYTSATSASESPVAITATAGTLSSVNYNFSFVNGQLTINKREAIVTADNKTVTYGDAAPAYTYSITGLAAGETAAVIAGTPVLSGTYSASTPATEIPVISISGGTLSSDNYTFALVNGQVTINHTFPLSLEAEQAAIGGGTIVTTFGGFTGTGYVDKLNKTSDYIKWTANVSGAGMATLTFRYALNNKTQNLGLTVNGQALPSVEFKKIGNWSNWGTVSVSVNLNAGINTIQLNGGGTAGPSVDNLLIQSEVYPNGGSIGTNQISSVSAKAENNLQLAAPIFTELVSAGADLQVYPVPAVNDLKVSFSANNNDKVAIQVIDMQGRVVYTKNSTASAGTNTFELDINSIAPGNYLLKVNAPGFSKSRMIMVGK